MPPLPADVPALPEVLTALLHVSLSGTLLLRPGFAPDNPGTITEWICVYLNPAGQRLLGQPGRPAGPLFALFPALQQAGPWLAEVFHTGQTRQFTCHYPLGSLAPTLQLAGQRAGDLLVLSLTAAELPGEAPGASQEREQLAETEHRTAEPDQEPEAHVFERTQALHHAQAAAQAVSQQLRHLTESLPSMTFMVEADGRVRYISPQWYAYTGMTPDADINDAWPILMHPDDLPAIAQEFGAALAEGRAWRYEFRLRGASGQYRWFASQGAPEPLADAEAAGRPRQWYGSNLDIDDLKQAELRLAQQEQLLTNILLSLPAGVVTFEARELRYSFFNDTFQRQVQHRAVLGRTLTELFPEAEEQGFVQLLRQVLHTGKPFVAQEMPSYLLDPHTGVQQAQFTDVAYVPLRHGSQPPYAVLSFSLDATERVRTRHRAEAAQAQALAAAEQLAAQRETFYQVFEQTPACIALLRGPDHSFEYVNPAYQQLFPGRQLVGLPIAEALPEVREQGFLTLLNSVLHTGETYYGHEMLFRAATTPGGPPRDTYYDFTYQVLREEGRSVGISIFATEVTERVLARRAHLTQQQQLETLFAQSPAPLVIFDGPELVYQLANPAYQRIFPGRELLGKPLLEALPELIGHPLIAELRQAYATGTTYVAQELPLQLARTAGGPIEDIYWTFTYQPRRNAAGDVDGVLVFAADVTDQVLARRVVEDSAQRARRHAEQLEAANAQLRRTNADLDAFVYTASHDLRTPISNIEGLLLALREELGLPAAEQAEVPTLLDLMQRDVERFQRTIGYLTDVTTLQKAAHEQVLTNVALQPIIEDVCSDLTALMRQTHARLEVDVAACPQVWFSAKNLRSVVYNLLSNALKYHHPDRPPYVRLRCYPLSGYQVLEVQDNGLGLSTVQQAKAFGLFQRLHDHVEGSGVGLYVTQKLLDNVGGRIEISSEPGAGSTFRLYFPAGTPATP